LKDSSAFNRYFELRWYERFNRRLLTIFSFTASVVLIGIIVIANQNYRELNRIAEQKIREQYISTLENYFDQERDLDSDQQFSESGTPGAQGTSKAIPESAAERRARQRRDIENRVSVSGVLAELANTDPYSDLPLVDDLVAFSEKDMVVDIEQNQNRGRLFSNIRSDNRNYNPDDIDEPMLTPFNYNLSRRGNVLIEFTDELINESEREPIGYRDPDEIYRVVNRYRPMIEYCYNKEARHISGLRGYVKVKFSISYKGHVIPESIRILNSTIRNRSVEQCIKSYIRRWRNFEELDESMGIAQVVQKFIFN
jgi:hypothetical protein